MVRVGIYGYECSVEMIFDEFKIIPVNTDFNAVKKLSSDNQNYHLTAILEINKIQDVNNFIFNLEAILAFIDHRDVVIQNFLKKSEEPHTLNLDFPRVLLSPKRLNGGGKTIMSDAFVKDSRRDFINLAMKKLLTPENQIDHTFRSAFFKTIEVFKGRECFIDISYYLRFSALESLSRAASNDYESKNCATPIAKLLVGYSFDIQQDNLKNPHKSVFTYVSLRNALFHNGCFEATVNRDGEQITYKLSEYSSTLTRLIPLVMIKYIGFDDGYINWNSWLDSEGFKAPDKSC